MNFIRHCGFHDESCKKDWWIEGILEDCEYEYEKLLEAINQEKK